MKKRSNETHKNDTGAQENIDRFMQAEDALRQSEIKYRTLFESASDAILLMDQDIFIDCNQKALEMFGCTREQIIGQSPYRFSLEVQPDGIKSTEKGLEKINAAIKGLPQYFEWKHCRYDGTLFDAEIGLNAFKDKNKYYIQTIVRDITERKRTDEALQESERKYKFLTEKMNDMVWLTDMELQTIYVTPSIEKVLGFSQEERMHQSVTEQLTADSLSLVLETMARQLILEKQKYGDPERSVTIALEYYHKDGSTRWLETIISGIRDDQGVLTGLYGVARDITERKRAEEALRAFELTYQTIFETTGTTMLIVEEDMTISLANNGFESLTGYTRKEVEGKRKWTEFIEKDDLKKMITYHQLRRTAPGLPAKTYEFRLVHRDGYHKNIILTVNIIPGTKKSIASLIDITERKQMEYDLRASEINFRHSIDDSPLGVRIVTIEGETIYANKAILDMYGYDNIEELKTISLKERYTPESYAESLVRKEKRLRGELGPMEYEISIVRKNGEIRHLYVFRKEIFWNGKKQSQVICQNITLRRQAEEKLRETLESLRKSIKTTIQVLGTASEARDPYTAGHQKRVADLARTIATELGLSQDVIEGIRMAGSIHDIGKLSIPAEILSKPTKLTNIEFSLIKEHPRIGFEMLQDVESPWPLAQIVYQHHERMNGSGYPRNLKGDEILIEARIMAVADVVEAMSSHRPYRPGLGIEAALEEIEKNKGIFYDNTVVDVCLKLFRKKGYQLK